MNDNISDPTNGMSPLSAALFNCFRDSDPHKQIAALDNLRETMERQRDELTAKALGLLE